MVLCCYLLIAAMMLATIATSTSTSTDNDGSVVPTATLSNGHSVPLVGLGCASGVRGRHVTSALQHGYQFIDTAQSYNWGYHEDEVGTALHEYTTKQNKNTKKNTAEEEAEDGIFLQTKIHPEDLGYHATKQAIARSLQRLQVDSIDSVLIHKPQCWEGICSKVPEGTWQESWKVLEELYTTGIISKAIGICDVSSREMLDELLAQTIPPMIIQNYFDPLHQDTTMRLAIQQAGILYQGYSTLGTQWKYKPGFTEQPNPVLQHPVLQHIAHTHNQNRNAVDEDNTTRTVDVGQVIINWATHHHHVAVLPASTNTTRQHSNLYNSFRFTLSEEEVQLIDGLDGSLSSSSHPKKKKEHDDNPSAAGIQFQFEDSASASSNSKSNSGDNNNIVDVYWIGPKDEKEEEEEVHVGSILQGTPLLLNTYFGHTFRFRNHIDTEAVYSDYIIEQRNGPNQVHSLTVSSSLLDTTDMDDNNDDDEELWNYFVFQLKKSCTATWVHHYSATISTGLKTITAAS